MSNSGKPSDVMLRHDLVRGTILLVLSASLTILLFPPFESMDYVFYVLSSSFNVAPEVFLMVIDLLLLLAGFWFAGSLNALLTVGALLSNSLLCVRSRLGSINKALNRKGWGSLILAAGIIVFWHVPAILDAALLSYTLHLIMHASMFVAGLLIYVGSKWLSPNMRLLTYLLGCKGMAIFGAYLLVSPIVVYGSYPFYEQAEAGAAMVAMCVASDATIIPIWLRRYFSKQ
ncbi:MAG TPA: cytochrome c oxidase assembly protein [Methylomirabilota bacterium]|nr:cytochrome c oxidase assembly protein [Methylomirabilota bacterium]